MPMINIQYDDAKSIKKDALALCNAIQKIVSNVTKIEDVFVYANSSEIRLKAAPVEIFVQMTGKKISNEKKLISDIKSQLSLWKKNSGFKHSINLTVIPMNWLVEIGI